MTKEPANRPNLPEPQKERAQHVLSMPVVLRRALMFLLAVVFLVSMAYLLYDQFYLPSVNQKMVQSAQTLYQPAEGGFSGVYLQTPAEDAGAGEEDTGAYTPAENPGFAALQEINEDIIGWIYIPNTVINYPALQSSLEDPEFYLYRDYQKNHTKYGSIFLQSDCDIQTSQNLVLYGHNMKNGSQFAGLLPLAELENYQKSPVVSFEIEGEPAYWKIFSVYKTNTLASQGPVFDFMQANFESTGKFIKFVQEVQARSLLTIPNVDVKTDDRILTMVTCSYEYPEARTVVVARQVRNGEEIGVDTSIASVNPNPVFPEKWW